jgi:hypothetical protein
MVLPLNYLDEVIRIAVNRFVRDKLKAKLKVPRPVSVQQHPKAIETFKKTFVLC